MNDHPDDPPDLSVRPSEDFDVEPIDAAEEVRRVVKEQYDQRIAEELGKIPRPINWQTLSPEDLEAELLELNEWVDWLRHTYGLPPQIVPPMWHRHPELLWELSALRQHWLFCYDRQAKGNQGVSWHQDFAIARERLRDWVTISGTRLDRDRPTRITPWPGGESDDWTDVDTTERPIRDRNADFVEFVREQVRFREVERVEFLASVAAEDPHA